jgi:hypothetical protein
MRASQTSHEKAHLFVLDRFDRLGRINSRGRHDFKRKPLGEVFRYLLANRLHDGNRGDTWAYVPPPRSGQAPLEIRIQGTRPWNTSCGQPRGYRIAAGLDLLRSQRPA